MPHCSTAAETLNYPVRGFRPARRKVPGDPTGGVTVVNDLVLTATYQGSVVALNRKTGAVVWKAQEPGMINGWMSVVGSEIFVPVGSPAQLVALRLGAP